MVFFNFWCRVLSENPSTPVIKKCVKISECVKFEGDILETGEDVDPQNRKILQMFVWWVFSLSALDQKLEKPWKGLFVPLLFCI